MSDSAHIGAYTPTCPTTFAPLRIRDAHESVGQSPVAAVAGICGGGVVVRVTSSWSEPLVMWQALVGRRFSGKSPALSAMRGLLIGLEAELKESDPERAPRVVATDAAHTALSDALSARRHSVLLWCDDASSWFADLAEIATAVSVLGSMRPDLMAALA